jgi:O-antigen ligase
MFVGFGLLIYDRMFSRVSFRWLALIIASAVGIIAAFLISNSPVGFIVSHLTFSPQSGYYREWTWHMVGLYVSQSPWVGLGYGEMPEEINHSIDSLWLILSIHSGYPGAVLIALSLFGAAATLTRSRASGLTPVEAKLATTLGILLFLTAYISFTVHLWGTSWILTGLLIGTKAHLSELGYLRAGAAHQRLS